ncbi:MAG: undecaprenyl-diphosphate phosphatase, partial [bacterium]
MELWQAIILGIIEGITEFLPVSSTGHLILASHIIGIPQNEFVKTFQIFIQFGAILAVIVLYFKKLVKNIEIWKRIIIAFIPTGILGLIFYKFIKNYLIGNDVVVVFALITGGIILIIADRYSGKFFKYSQIEKMGFLEVFIIGVFQSLAMVPGVSRSGATIIGGM